MVKALRAYSLKAHLSVSLLAQFYTEVSPSGKGLHIFLKGNSRISETVKNRSGYGTGGKQRNTTRVARLWQAAIWR